MVCVHVCVCMYIYSVFLPGLLCLQVSALNSMNYNGDISIRGSLGVPLVDILRRAFVCFCRGGGWNDGGGGVTGRRFTPKWLVMGVLQTSLSEAPCYFIMQLSAGLQFTAALTLEQHVPVPCTAV